MIHLKLGLVAWSLCGTLAATAQTEHILPLLQSVGQPFLKTTGDTLNLPFEDDFSAFSAAPASRWWVDNKASVNRTMGLDERTLGVATLDGLDELGFPYDPTDNTSDTLADVLTSRYINLLPSQNGLWLTFFYQNGGRGERAEPDDTLVLDFWSPATQTWNRAWDTTGGPAMTTFRAVAVAIADPQYKNPGFRFRFGGKGARNGQFDVWNIDYVQLGAGRSAADTSIVDPGFTRWHPSLINGFESIPGFHYKDTLFQKSEFDLFYRKNGPPGSANINLRKFNLKYNGTIIASQNGVPFNTGPFDVENLLTVPFPVFNIPGPRPPEFELEMTSIMDGANDGIRTNDTIQRLQVFRNYYAYDDGSAERGYGVTNFSGAKTAMAWQPVQPDSLKGIYLYFAQAGNDPTTTGFRIGVWNNNQGFPGTLIYLSDSVYKPVRSEANVYLPYALDTAIYINGPVFIGVQQSGTIPLNIGFDVNNVNATTLFYGNSFTWFPSLFSGTLMLRPYVRYQPLDLSVPEPEPIRVLFYPQPAKHRLFARGMPAHEAYQVIDLQGRILLKGPSFPVEEGLDVQGLQPGMYLLQTRLMRASFLVAP
jgi:hypothetical protein